MLKTWARAAIGLPAKHRIALRLTAFAALAFTLPPLQSQPAASAPEGSLGDAMAQHEQTMYRLNVRRAIVSTPLLTVAWPLKPVEKLVAQKKRLEGDAATVLTLHAQALSGVGAPLYELEVPEGYAKERFTSEYAVARLQEALAPLEQSLAFRAGHRYEDARDDTPRHPNTLEVLITGDPSPMEQAVKRMAAKDERKRNRASHIAITVLGIAALALLLKTRASTKAQ